MNRLGQLRCAARRGPALGGLVLLLCFCALSPGQSSRPAAGSIETQAILRHPPAEKPSLGPVTIVRPGGFADLWRVVLATGAVVGLILGLWWAAKKYLPGMNNSRAAGVVRVLAQTPITTKQQVLLVQVGKRVLVVADNGTQMSRLSEIVDPDEVAALIGQLAAPQEPVPEEFVDQLGKASRTFDQNMDVPVEPDATPATEPPIDTANDAVAEGEIQDLMQKVRGLAQQLGKG